MIGAIGDTSVAFIEGESLIEEDRSRENSMYQIRENEEEVNNSFDDIRKTVGHKRQKSYDDCDGNEQELESPQDYTGQLLEDRVLVLDSENRERRTFKNIPRKGSGDRSEA